jgi:glycosyltransferase involved in cell wall biosynthesis
MGERLNMKVMSVLNLRPRKLGSFEEYTVSLSRALVHRGGQSVLVFKELPPAPLLPQYLEAGAILETKPFAALGRHSAGSLRDLLRRHRPDVVHLHFVDLLSLDVVAAALYRGVRVVFSDHGSDTPKERSAIKTYALRGSVRTLSSMLDRLVAPSDYVNARLVRAGVSADQVTTVHNGVNLEEFRNTRVTGDCRAKYGIPPSSVMVVSISQLIPEKGIDYLIEAAALALRQGADLSFIHVGDGARAAEYRTKVQKLGMEGRFIFAGLLNLREIAAILLESNIFALPCTWGEAFSLAILEAAGDRDPRWR